MKAREDRIAKALEIRETPGAIFKASTGNFIVKSQSKTGRTYVVGIKHGSIFCSCVDFELHGTPCKHSYAACAPAAVAFLMHLRWLTEAEELEIAMDLYAPKLRELPEAFKSICRDEYRAAVERLTTSAAVAA